MTPSMPELLSLYSGLATQFHLPDMRGAGLHVQSHDVLQAADVHRAVLDFAGACGWLTCTQANLWLDGITQAPAPAHGTILDGELSSAQGLSLQIRHLGDRWRLTTIEHREQGSEYLFDEIQLMGKTPAPRMLRYRRYWRPSANSAANSAANAAANTVTNGVANAATPSGLVAPFVMQPFLATLVVERAS